MSQPAKELKELEAKVEAKKQELHQLQTATKAAHDEWDDQRKQIASDTQVAIQSSREAITEATNEAKETLKGIQLQIDMAEGMFERTEQAQEDTVAGFKRESERLERDKKVLQTTNTNLRESNQTLTSEITVSQELLDGLKADETALNLRVSDLNASITEKQTELDTIYDAITSKTEEFTTITRNFNIAEDNYTKKITLLEQKEQDLTQQIIQNREKDDEVRENLAVWEKKLAEKEKNLRIREEQVNIQQKAISRNYNLLNM